MIYNQTLCCLEIKLLVNCWQATMTADGPCEPLAQQQQSRAEQHPKACCTPRHTYDTVWWMGCSLQSLQSYCHVVNVDLKIWFLSVLSAIVDVTMLLRSAHSPSVLFFFFRHKARKPSHQLRWRPEALWLWWAPLLNPHAVRAAKRAAKQSEAVRAVM